MLPSGIWPIPPDESFILPALVRKILAFYGQVPPLSCAQGVKLVPGVHTNPRLRVFQGLLLCTGGKEKPPVHIYTEGIQLAYSVIFS